MQTIRYLPLIGLLACQIELCAAEEVQFGPWKATYDADGLKTLSFDNVVWLEKSSLTVFKPGYKEHWFDMTGATVTTASEPDHARITWNKTVEDRFEAELELTLVPDAATWRGRLKVGVEGPVEMGILIPPARLESPGGVIHYDISGREMELARGESSTFAAVTPVTFNSPEWTATFEAVSSSRPWLVQDRRTTSDSFVRFISCFSASGKEPLEARASLSLRLKRHSQPELAARTALLSQRMRTLTPVPVKNSGFEEGDTPLGWKFGPSATVVEDNPAEGKRCLRIAVPKAEGAAVYVTQQVPIQAGSRYRLSAMVRGEGVKRADMLKMPSVGDTVIIEWADKDGKWLAAGAYADQASFGTHGWQRRECREVAAPAEAAYAIIFLALRGLGSAWFDDVRLTECRPSVALVSPLDGASLSDNRPLFTWRMDPDAQGYQIDISSDSAMARDRVQVSAACQETRFRPEKPLPPGKWFWRVSRHDGFSSTVWSFTQTAPADADTTGPTICIEYFSIEMANQSLNISVADPSGVDVNRLKLQVDGTAVDAAVEEAETALRVRPRTGWQNGAHLVTILASDRKGNEASEAAWIAVAPPPPQKIIWTRDRGVLIGDKHRFPVGIYQVTEADMPRVKSAGFDFVHNYQWEGSQDDDAARAYLDAVQRNGLMAFVGFDRGASSHNGLCQLNLEHVSRRIAALRDHPALLAWYLFDEPDLSHQYVAPQNLLRLYEHIHKLDPYHPVIVTFAVGDSPSKYPRCYDVYWTMVYRTTEKLDEKMRRDRAAIGDAPLMAICHCYDQKQTQVLRAGESANDAAFQPDLRWMRANACTALANGSSAMCWWWFGNHRKSFLSVGDVPQAWGWLTQVVRELRELEPVLTAEGKRVEVTVSPQDLPLRVWARAVGKRITILTANCQEKSFEAVLTAPGFPSSGEAAVRFESRKVLITDGKLKDSFAPLQPHVYEIELP